jgi:hypothetical protein
MVYTWKWKPLNLDSYQNVFDLFVVMQMLGACAGGGGVWGG